MSRLVTALQKVVSNDTARKDIIKKAKDVVERNSFMNCRLFTQLVTDTPKIENQPELKSPEVGAILWWGSEQGYRHCAVALDDETLVQIPEWGQDVEISTIKDIEKEYGPVDKIFKPK